MNSKEDNLRNVGKQPLSLTSIVWEKVLWKSLATVNCLICSAEEMVSK